MKTLLTLNRRLDREFEIMELRWAEYRQDRNNADKLKAYLVSLRRADRLWEAINNI